MKRITHREYLTRQVWLDEQWNQPSRNDQYLMQIAAEVRRVLSKKPNAVKLDHFKLSFGTTKANAPTESDKAQAVETSKSRWFGSLNIKRKPKKQ